ncbi:protein translocase subunit SecD [Leptolyngbya sp. AN02str]|uniref:protein translocase subunit SecD n=1 Tax=Leptolyngbya sp. AN02str TaxID=3423363 RepID=UPI003D318A9B
MGRQRSLLAFILVLTIASIVVLTQIPMRLGLDLRGGSQLTLQALPTDAVPEITPEKLEGVRSVVERRINGLGVSESVVQTAGEDQLVVQLPGVSDPEQAERVLGGTAQLDFRQQRAGTEGNLQAEFSARQTLLQEQATLLASGGDEAAIARNQQALDETNASIATYFDKTELTGDRLTNAYAAPISGSAWEVGIEFDDQGGNQFAELTKNIAGTGRGLGIFLDNELLSAPTVEARYAETGITGGRASITGGFNAQRAADLSLQLRSGALPVPVEIVENRTVGATLGRDSIQRSLYAGLAGLVFVLVFMVFYYRLPGAIADVSLIIYSLLSLAVFDLLGVTLTLPGIAGFILSIGMAVDANVLIFERTREELRAGKTLYRSVESGFYRAFSSILDSNVTTLIACGALFWLGSGFVRGFALTLALGVLVSMFTALTCSRTLLLFVLSFPGLRKPQYFAPKLSNSSSQANVAS